MHSEKNARKNISCYDHIFPKIPDLEGGLFTLALTLVTSDSIC